MKAHTMRPTRGSEIAIGILFFVATISYLTGSELILSATSGEEFLSGLDDNQVRLGVMLEFINSAAVVGIGVLLFPILRRHSEQAALGYTISRSIEAALLFLSTIGALILINLANEYATGDATTASRLQILGNLAFDGYEIAFQIGMLALGAGSLLLCLVLYRAALVPRALAILGFVGYLALFSNSVLVLLGYDPGLILFMPGAVFEIVFPLWLIFKGFTNVGPATLHGDAELQRPEPSPASPQY